MNQLVLFLSTLGPIGTRLPAPGTMGSIFGTLLYAFLTLGIGWSAELVALAFVPLFLIGIPLCSRAEILLDRSDPSEVIWDEFSVIPFVFLPLSQPLQEPISQESCLWLGIGLILFRIFDILKPSIIRTAQKLPRGLGVMIDDLLAAGVSALVLWSAKTFSLSFFA
jgi:phosphatidylglycerophosphatase A